MSGDDNAIQNPVTRRIKRLTAAGSLINVLPTETLKNPLAAAKETQLLSTLDSRVREREINRLKGLIKRDGP
ncbi:hypothetical protein BaRGS_00023278 [Batillaria attramentaria]|uniref:Uncharacterized protein n=1 Tax=Batillaria attramentaria TaxID=370345 RepID=A0ABD0KE64_9CAEN